MKRQNFGLLARGLSIRRSKLARQLPFFHQEGETQSPSATQSDQGSLRREFIQRMDSHASQVRDLIDQRLDSRLTAFQEQISTIIHQA